MDVQVRIQLVGDGPVDWQSLFYAAAEQMSYENLMLLFWAALIPAAAIWMLLKSFRTGQVPVYLLDHCVLKPDDKLQVSNEKFMEKSLASNVGNP